METRDAAAALVWQAGAAADGGDAAAVTGDADAQAHESGNPGMARMHQPMMQDGSMSDTHHTL